MNDYRLARNFPLREFLYSRTANANGIDNALPDHLLAVAEYGAREVLQPARDTFGPIYIQSGYRCPTLNTAVGGVDDSQHTLAEAADINAKHATLGELARWMSEARVPFDQLILEPSWVHVSWTRRGAPRGEVLSALRQDDGSLRYVYGLHD